MEEEWREEEETMSLLTNLADESCGAGEEDISSGEKLSDVLRSDVARRQTDELVAGIFRQHGRRLELLLEGGVDHGLQLRNNVRV